MIPTFENIFSIESLYQSFLEFRKGKKAKSDVTEFSLYLASNLRDLHDRIMSGSYRHGGYFYFKISDPKPREIHKASVKDRVVHHALYRALYPYFDKQFIHDSYSCRVDKGTHRAGKRFDQFAGRESRNVTKTVWVLKGDIRKCFASVDHRILKEILAEHITCQKTLAIIHSVIDSFSIGNPGTGIPLGNLTSQLFINIYLNRFDQYLKRDLCVRSYIRYADDFVIFSPDRDFLAGLIPKLEHFLECKLKFHIHPDKISIRTCASGVDFLGWVHFPYRRVLRTKTKRRMLRRITEHSEPETITSYIGLLSHGDAYKLQRDIIEANRHDTIEL